MAKSTTTNPRVIRHREINAARKAEKAKKEAKPVHENKEKEVKAMTREMTIHMHRYLHKESFKKRAPKAIKIIRFLAMKTMKTHTVKFDTGLNEFIWSQGIRVVADRIRVRMAKLPVEGEEGKFYTLVSYVPVNSFKGLKTVIVEEAAE